MDVIVWLVQSALTVGAVLLTVGALATLFMIIFSIGIGIDRRIGR